MCWTVIGGLETGCHGNRPFQNDQVAILIERMKDQEDRLRTLEKARSEQARVIVEKDRKIKNLEQEVYDIKQKIISINRLISGHKNEEMGNKWSHISELDTQVKGRYPTESERWGGFSSGTQNKSNETDEIQKRVNVFENQKLKNKDSTKSSKPVGIGRKQFERKINKRVDSTPTTAVAFSVFLGSSTDVVTQSIIKYDGVMIDKGN
ncbi:uncharacterized protein [Argopecten irradians]|uniref:uncharacterized protein n=1 Tax=Argopecten irradians TaxID=31199 RepID=UPI00371CADDC